ncbi:bifunctional 2-C-methyl-D-erythritol 4-phosphate cytidylyltransferase/2-C-methyl-D-erythritol 2,4-cyclodiphosphate synthase [Rhodobacteraceae bacterium SC52]|nr:bifunctional 2-C-methyl-D-erythritol 4-phosphate cytidylyltransferase/2-C-methyl-D-erythritol 2,4-cyclodiphosphate synthase [Rhodobacteraceae bacterium SC52]
MTVAGIVVAAGRGTRAGGETPKQFQPLGGSTVLGQTLAALSSHPALTQLVVVLHPDDTDLYAASINLPEHCAISTVPGGATRDASVRAGLAALQDGTRKVLIHDAARPFVTQALIKRVIDALDHAPGAAPALAVTDALWRGNDGNVVALQDRTGLFRAQTPQGFRTSAIRAAHASHSGGAADDVAVALAHGLDVTIVEGDEDNIKITLPGDFARAEALLAQREKERHAMDIRLGNGFDVHRFCEGDAVILCGVKVPHTHALDGHSDADVGMHAVTDAIYGALAEGDIGRHFPPSDPQWKGAASEVFLRHAVDLARAKGFSIGNVDCTLICEFPKIGPHGSAMQAEMARIMGLDPSRVSVKATTSERLGFTGRGEGIASIATATLVAP